MDKNPDRLYELLPAVYRLRDVEQGHSLQALLRVIAEQVDVVEADIEQLYENWFIETCEDWVVPYIGDLVGYRIVHEAGQPGEVITPRGRELNRFLIPRREVANTIRYRRRKGTLPLLELLANNVAGWPARAVEFYRLLGWTQAINHRRPERGRTVDLRQGDALDRLDGPFDELAHTVDVRRVGSKHVPAGRFNIPSVGVFVWRLRAYPVTKGQACCLEDVVEAGPHCFTFSFLGNDTLLYACPQPETDPTHIATEANLPTPIRRRAFEDHPERFYGEGKSIQIWKSFEDDEGILHTEYVPLERIIPANLKDWQYEPSGDDVAVDPVLGRIAFDSHRPPEQVWVSYYYGFSADIGGGEYNRPIQPVEPSTQPDQPIFYRVSAPETPGDRPINRALAHWETVKAERPHAVIELVDSSEYPEQLDIRLEQGQTLQIRAANHRRPLIYVADLAKGRPDYLKVTGESGGRFTLDGLLITGRGVRVKGNLNEINIRHCTLVPGLELFPYGRGPRRPTAGPSLQIQYTTARFNIAHSIIGSIKVYQDEVQADPTPIYISGSILDATSVEREALASGSDTIAHAVLTIARSTVIGQVRTHAIELAEDCIFNGRVMVARRQLGCMRFCYVTPGSRTPRRFNCQPDLAERAIEEEMRETARQMELPEPNRDEITAAQQREQLRVRPQFNSMRYGTPTYCQLAETCAKEIKRGADDESEMGVFHDLYQPQRAANLRARIDEYTPAGMDAGIVFAS